MVKPSARSARGSFQIALLHRLKIAPHDRARIRQNQSPRARCATTHVVLARHFANHHRDGLGISGHHQAHRICQSLAQTPFFIGVIALQDMQFDNGHGSLRRNNLYYL